ncbi:CASR protein, partial [Atractosteus spatula]|nr:CASR protein [Atractosteus spatula]
MLGGIFAIHFSTVDPKLSFTSKPEQWRCESLDFAGFQWAQTMAFAIEEINRNPALLPNITLGYRLYDNCVNLAVALRAATALISGEEDFFTDYSCTGTPPVLAIVGDPGSTHSIAISRMLGLFRMPVVIYYATCSCLSSRKEFPSFFRTIPSDTFQVKAMVQIIRHYGWTWIGVIVSNDDYGLYALKTFTEEVNRFGCIAFSETLPSVNRKTKILQIINSIKKSTARVIVVFSSEANLIPLVEEVVHQNITGRQWIASEAWSTSTVILREENFSSFGGTIGIAISRGEIPGLEEFLLQISPTTVIGNNLIKQFWEKIFHCKFQENSIEHNSSSPVNGIICTGSEDVEKTRTSYSDVSELRASYNVYKAVYALAHSLHNLMSCEPGKGPFQNNSCADITTAQPWQLLHYLARVNFTTHYGDRVSFDENGDALAIYDVMNWQRADDGAVKTVTIGLFDESAPAGQELTLNEDKIFWNFDTVMAFAIEEINRDPALLPNITLGYRLYDNCVNLAVALRAATALISGEEDSFTDYSCTGTPPVLAIVGDPGSTNSITISRILGLFRVPMVHYYATCSCLSNRIEFPTFFRTIPSDKFQVKAMAEIIKHYGWTWVGVVASNDDYGQNAVKSFIEEINKFGCIAFSETLPKEPLCKLQENFELNGLYKKGDVILGGIFEAHLRVTYQQLTFTSIPEKIECGRFSLAEYQKAQVMAFAIEEINRDPALLPNITLGYRLYDNCVNLPVALRAATALISGEDDSPPRSVCSESCQPGTRKATRKGEPLCCFDCVPCAEGEISNHTALQVLSLKQPICKIQGKFELNGLYKNGDIVLGGIFEAHFAVTYPELHFRSKPDQLKCKSFSVLAFQEAQTMIFAIEEINRDPALLPNITLGYRLYDNCENLGVALRAATALISGEEDSFTDYSCTGTPPVLAIVGDPGSTNSIAVSRLLGHFQVPMVSYFATCSCLSNRKEFPSFFRTIPSDAFQVKAMVQIIKHYGWTWVGAIASSDDYGQSAIKSFIEEVNKFGCIAFSETLHSVLSKARVLQILQIIKQSTARVIVVFSQGAYFIPLALEIARHNITDRQWIASEAWTTSTVILREENFHSFGGTIGIAIRRGEIPGLKEFLLQAHPVSDPKNNFINLFWESLFDCKLQDIQKYNSSSEDGNKICTGYEDINSIETLYSDVSELRTAYTVYKAVYALAHALHNLMSCEPGKGPFQNNSCADITTVQPWQLLQYLARVNFTTHYGDRVSFDENGDALAIYDVMNWQRADDGAVKRVTIGLYDESAPAGRELSLNEDKIFWNFESKTVSYFATCSCLSNRKEFPSFFRTIPSDAFQVKAMVQILRHYGWTWVGVIASSDDYGQSAVKSFIEEVNMFGCIAFSETLPSVNLRMKIHQIINTIKQSTARVIVVFSSEAYFIPVAEEIVLQDITDRQWIASEAWTSSTVILSKENFQSFGGTIGIAICRGEIPGLETFLLKIHPVDNSSNSLLNQFWEKIFNCKFQAQTDNYTFPGLTSDRICTGSEDIESAKTAYSDVSELRSSYNVYKAVYALAHALHNLMSCEPGKGPFQNNSCADITTVQPWQLLHYLARVNFTTHHGDRVSFDENGDALAIYDVMNWQRADDGSVKTVTIGLFDESAPAGQELTLNEDKIFWNFESDSPPRSVCSESCQPGTRKATRKGEPLCCFDCVPCAEGEISNHTDSTECFQCPPDFWSNPSRDQCVLKEIEFLSYEEIMGISLTTVSVFGAFISAAVLSVFIYYRNTPVVRANNSELSFLLLLSLILCFLCSLLFIGQPLHLTCMLRHVVFGISFVLCISCILVKTIVVIMAFRATLPDNNVMKWFGAAQQRGTVFVFTVIQALICIIWLSTASPVPFKNTQYQNSKIIFECNVGSITGFSFLLGYIGLLASVCFLLAFLARNLPDNFNEAKFITFSMLIFCAVWIAFIPAYVSSPGKYSDAVEIFAILASSFGLLIAIFAPKCYIILLHPEKNTKKALMGRAGKK